MCRYQSKSRVTDGCCSEGTRGREGFGVGERSSVEVESSGVSLLLRSCLRDWDAQAEAEPSGVRPASR